MCLRHNTDTHTVRVFLLVWVVWHNHTVWGLILWYNCTVSPGVVACRKWLDLAFYTTPMARQKYFNGFAIGLVCIGRSDLSFYTTPMARQKIFFLPPHSGSIDNKVHTRNGDSLHIQTTPMAKQKQIFLPRHWGSIEAQQAVTTVDIGRNLKYENLSTTLYSW